MSRETASAIARIATAHLEHFPETVFWDYDYLTAFLDDAPRSPNAIAEDFVNLFAQFGRHSIIAFRYVHDFFFGFDWVKWVQKDPGSRATSHPFDKAALDYLANRGREIERLIANDDSKYPKLRSGEPRNAYGFSRDIENEKKLFQTLAADDLIPLKMWLPTVELRPSTRFLEERERVAASLGMS